MIGKNEKYKLEQELLFWKKQYLKVCYKNDFSHLFACLLRLDFYLTTLSKNIPYHKEIQETLDDIKKTLEDFK